MKNKTSWLTSVGKSEHTEYCLGVRAVPMRLAIVSFLFSAFFPSLSRAQAPVFEITPRESSIKFDVEASVAIEGTFDKWDASLSIYVSLMSKRVFWTSRFKRIA